MPELYEFLTGPALWVVFAVFFGGLLGRALFLAGLSRGRDKVLLDHFDWAWSWRSIWHWLLPLGSRSLRQQPLFGLVIWVFHVCWIGLPLFLSAHNILWEEAFGWSLWTLPDTVSDTLTVVVVVCVAFMLVRRLVRPEVRIMTQAWDYILLLLAAAPFVTGFLAYHHIGPYEVMLILHILLSEILLVIIPFSKLGHLILFFFSRANIGTELGARREQGERLGATVW